MTKQGNRSQLSICFFQGLRAALKEDPSMEVVNVQVCLVEKPDYGMAGSFRINLITKSTGL